MTMKKKLNSQSGVTILYGLLALLVASVISATIISAALTSIKLVKSDQDNQQAILTMQSAAQLVRDEMESTKYIKTATTTIAGTTETVSATGTFATEIQTAVNQVENNPVNYETTFTISAESMGLDSVSVRMEMMAADDVKYQIKFAFASEDGENLLYLTMNGSPSESVVQKVKTTTISWSSGVISPIGGVA